MKNVFRLVVLVAIGVASFTRGVQAAPITFVGSDNAAGTFAALVASQAAAAAFDAAAGGLGSMSLVDFESIALGSVAGGVSLGGGATVSGSGDVVNAPINTPALFGFNTTVGGQNFVLTAGGDLTFSFASPIQAFGAYFTGIQSNAVGQETLEIHYTGGATQLINIPNLALSTSGGGAFVGFTDVGASIDSITLHFLNDIVGTDDVRFGPSAAVPEPATLLLTGAGLVGLAARRRRRSRSL